MARMAKAVRIYEFGDADVLKYDDVEVPDPGPGEVLLEQTAIGLNFVDVAMRMGRIPFKTFPVILGMEAAGTVAAVGEGVAEFAPGDRVSHSMVNGSYAEMRVIAADRLVRLPDGISDEVAAAATLQGLTAEYLLRSCYAVQPGDVILVQAAAGGMGLYLCQWAKHLGATVIGTVGSDDKAELARAHGCDHPIVYTRENFVERVKEITDGAGVRAVYDAVGKDTFEGGLQCLGVRGHMVSYGNSSGPIAPIDIMPLGAKSQTVTRGSLATFVADPLDRARRAGDLWQLIENGTLRVEINQRYALSDVATAHDDLQGGRTTGSSVLIP